ncbi:MAG: protein-glutamate O-methyltransferase CheR [Deltaproteobacteria bacterium]|nr:protein-glutamate O-methyltransferase CheR [Deltaproteobacteria bacterium]
MANSRAGNLKTENSFPQGRLFQITDREFSAFRDLILREAGISLSEGKRQLLCSRLAKRLRHFGFHTFSQYYDYLLTQDPKHEERLRMINCMTTNKTDFFRESHHFNFLSQHMIPQIRQRAFCGGVRKIRVWSAGCSSGEEPYSIAMTVREALGSLLGWDVKILASDIDTEMIRNGSDGIYAAERLSGVPYELKRKHFLRGKGECEGYLQVHPELRDLVVFRRINLMDEPWPIHTYFDAIFCRNVVIYFNRETQEKLFERLATYLSEEGYLFVGHSENLSWLSHLFAPLRGTIYRRRKPG